MARPAEDEVEAMVRARLRWVVAMGSCWLAVGCLFHRPGSSDPPPAPPVQAGPVKEEPPPPQKDFVLSDYRVLPGPPVARLSSAVDPLAWNVKADPPAASGKKEPAPE